MTIKSSIQFLSISSAELAAEINRAVPQSQTTVHAKLRNLELIVETLRHQVESSDRRTTEEINAEFIAQLLVSEPNTAMQAFSDKESFQSYAPVNRVFMANALIDHANTHSYTPLNTWLEITNNDGLLT